MNPLALWIFAGIVAIEIPFVIAFSAWIDLLDGHPNTKAED